MTPEEKKAIIKQHAIDMLNQSHVAMLTKIDKALNSGAIDVDSWDEKVNPMILIKSITTAILEDESNQWNGNGTSFEKQMKKEVKNIRCYL